MAQRGRPRKNPTGPIPEWASRIAAARDEAGLDQTGLGKRIGKSQQIVSEYESGQTPPSLAQFRAIGSALGVSPAWLAFGNPDDSDPLVGAFLERNIKNRLFSWCFHQAARFLVEEGVNADLYFTVSFARKLLKDVKDGQSDVEAKEIIALALDVERAKIREGLDTLRQKLL